MLLAVTLSALLNRVELLRPVAVAMGDDEIQHAHALYKAGEIDGYIALSESPSGVLLSRQVARDDAELAAVIDGAIDHALQLIGRDARDLGETMGVAS